MISKGPYLTLDAIRRSIRLVKRRSGVIFDSVEAFILDPVDPFVSGGPGDLISITQLTHRPLPLA
jgi:hypothetical protein